MNVRPYFASVLRIMMTSVAQFWLGALPLVACHTPREVVLRGRPHAVVLESTVAIDASRTLDLAELPIPTPGPGQTSWIELTLTAACGPLFTVEFPDGSHGDLGAYDPAWQQLLTAREQAAQRATLLAAAEANQAVAVTPTSVATTSDAGATVTAQATAGHWQAINVDSWPGQSQFQSSLPGRCAQRAQYHLAREVLLHDQPLRLVAAVPQEARDVEMQVRVYVLGAITRPQAPTPPVVRKPKPPKPTKPARPLEPWEITVDAETLVAGQPIPPKPAPQTEVELPQVEYTRWVSGHWELVITRHRNCKKCVETGRYEWQWRDGHLTPNGTPPPKPRPAPPIPDCEWVEGSWAWHGAWVWRDGHWLPPPRRNDTPSTPPPIRGSVWQLGNWRAEGDTFVWVTGTWRKPDPLPETPPSAPGPRAMWVNGYWENINNVWTWSSGYYVGYRPAAPAPQAENPGAAPGASAVWLGGYWRWNGRTHVWVSGHWEMPPGVGYVWVADPIVVGRPPSGAWQLRVDVNAVVPVTPRATGGGRRK